MVPCPRTLWSTRSRKRSFLSHSKQHFNLNLEQPSKQMSSAIPKETSFSLSPDPNIKGKMLVSASLEFKCSPCPSQKCTGFMKSSRLCDRKAWTLSSVIYPSGSADVFTGTAMRKVHYINLTNELSHGINKSTRTIVYFIIRSAKGHSDEKLPLKSLTLPNKSDLRVLLTRRQNAE